MMLPATPVLPQNMMTPADAAFAGQSLAGLGQNDYTEVVPPVSSPVDTGLSVPVETMDPNLLALLQSATVQAPIPNQITSTIDTGQSDPVCAANPALCSAIDTSGASIGPSGGINTGATDAQTLAIVASLLKMGLTTAQIASLPPGYVMTQQPNGTVTVGPRSTVPVSGGVSTPFGNVSLSGSGGVMLVGAGVVALLAIMAMNR